MAALSCPGVAPSPWVRILMGGHLCLLLDEDEKANSSSRVEVWWVQDQLGHLTRPAEPRDLFEGNGVRYSLLTIEGG